MPHSERVGEHLYRFYFTSRDEKNRSLIGYVNVDIRAPQDILDVASAPVLSRGQVGAFDDNGVSLGCIVQQSGETRLYYMGWNTGGSMPWRNSIGLAVREDMTASFTRPWRGPILDRSRNDPFSLSYPWVLRCDSGWLMWYGSHTETGSDRDDFRHVLKRARSDDGIDWRTDDTVVIGLEGDEFAITKPCVVRDRGHWRMWFSCCSFERYWIGYAESCDGEVWTRDDGQAGIAPAPEGWDRHSVEYASVFVHEEDWYMLYNGLGYGKTGFGLAILEQD